jgi:hypothetical protein
VNVRKGLHQSVSIVAVGAVAALGLNSPCTAQHPDAAGVVARLGLGVSADYFASLDPLVSPRTYSGTDVHQNGFYLSFATPGSDHEIEGWYGKLDVASDGGFNFTRRGQNVGTPESEAEILSASYTLLLRLANRWWAGFAVAADASHTKYEFGASAAEAFLYFVSLDLAGRHDFDLGPGRALQLRLRIPLVGWATRPPYSTVDEERLQASSDVSHRLEQGDWFTPASLRGVSARMRIQQELGSHVGVHAALRFGFVRYHGKGRFDSIRAGLDLGAFLRWPGSDR